MPEVASNNIDEIVSKLPGTADIALILGSGLGGFAESLNNAIAVSTRDLPGYPQSTVAGHAGRIIIGELSGARVVAFQGRVHLYEGYSAQQVVLPVRVAKAAGCKHLIVTNASGSFTKRFKAGDLLLIEDHINLQHRNPLRGPVIEGDPRWPDLIHCYDPELKALAERVALREGISLRRGTLAAVLGPTYETPAEAAMLARIGADAGCMSTVPEVITAAAVGLRTLGISCVTNSAGNITTQKQSHEDVQDVAQRTTKVFSKLLQAIIEEIAKLKGKS